MKKIFLLVAWSAMCASSQSLDLSSLDKLAAKAREVTKISLDKDQLQAALKMLQSDDKKDAEKKILNGLGSVQVRNFEFEKAGAYSDSDLDFVRAQVAKMQNCSSIIDSKEKDEHAQIFICSEDGKGSGLAIISAEPKEVSVVFIRGSVNLSDLGKLNGFLGIPSLTTDHPKSDQK